MLMIGLMIIIMVGTTIAFGPPSDLEFSPIQTMDPQEELAMVGKAFWEHDLLGKIGTHLIFFALTTILLLKIKDGKQFQRLRKALLFGSVVIIGFVWGGYLCPTTAVQNIFGKWDTAFLILFIIPVVISVFFGRVFCSTVCPFGALSELVYIAKAKLKIPRSIETGLIWVKYGLLAFQVIRMVGGASVNDSLTPFQSLFRWDDWGLNWGLSFAFLGLSVVTFRPFCRFLCPYGALLALASRFRPFRFREQNGCVHCNLCAKHCPTRAINDQLQVNEECINCGLCIQACRKDSWAYSKSQQKTKQAKPRDWESDNPDPKNSRFDKEEGS
jgi:ferredoxin